MEGLTSRVFGFDGSRRNFSSLVMVFITILFFAAPVLAEEQEYASAGSIASASGHYARARAMLVEALAEFDQATKIASPDMLLDTEEWRLSVISRTEDLNRLLDPQPRVTRDGVRFKASGLHVQHERTRVPRPEPDPYTVNTAGEDFYLEQKKAERLKALAEREREITSSMEEAAQGNSTSERVSDRENFSSAIVEDISPKQPLAIEVQPKRPVNSVAQPGVEMKKSLSIEEATKVKVPEVSPVTQAPLKGNPVKDSVVRDLESNVGSKSSGSSTAPKAQGDVSKAIEDVIKDRLKQLETERKSTGAR